MRSESRSWQSVSSIVMPITDERCPAYSDSKALLPTVALIARCPTMQYPTTYKVGCRLHPMWTSRVFNVQVQRPCTGCISTHHLCVTDAICANFFTTAPCNLPLLPMQPPSTDIQHSALSECSTTDNIRLLTMHNSFHHMLWWCGWGARSINLSSTAYAIHQCVCMAATQRETHWQNTDSGPLQIAQRT